MIKYNGWFSVVLVAMTLLGIGGAALPIPSEADSPIVWSDVRFLSEGWLALDGMWLGENIAVLRSESTSSEGELGLDFDRLETEFFGVLPTDVEAVFARGQGTEHSIPSQCRLAVKITQLGAVEPTLDYRPDSELVSPLGEPAAVFKKTWKASATERAAGEHRPRRLTATADFVADIDSMVSYRAAPGQLTCERDRLVFEVEPELRESYGLLMARRDNGDLYFWLVPR